MTDKHTPGPWFLQGVPVYGKHERKPDRLDMVASMGGSICMCYGERKTDNARLISAAPDLLAALEETLQALIDMLLDRDYTEESILEDPAVIKARAAIAHAKGES